MLLETAIATKPMMKLEEGPEGKIESLDSKSKDESHYERITRLMSYAENKTPLLKQTNEYIHLTKIHSRAKQWIEEC